MSAHFFSAADWLNGKNNHGYGPLPIPQHRDVQIVELLQAWLALDAPSRLAAAQNLQPSQCSVLSAFGNRMASLAVRENDTGRIHYGLLALGLGTRGGDNRNIEMILSLHYDAAHRLAGDADRLFEGAAQLLPAWAAQTLRMFAARIEADKLPQAMGYRSGRDADGFRYERSW